MVSCESDAGKNKPLIYGYWAMEKAFRDSKETTLLNDVYFRFDSTGTMATNLPNTAEGSTEYELKDNLILQKAPNPIEYSIIAVTDSTLMLALNIRETPFEFHLKKTTPPVPAPAESTEGQ